MKSLSSNAFFCADESVDGKCAAKSYPASISIMLRRELGIYLRSLGTAADLS
jgi:hypothetical protein